MNGQAQQGAQPPPMVVADNAMTMNAQLHAAMVVAGKAAGAQSAAEAKDFAAASLSLARAVALLDPTRLQGGDTAEARKASVPDAPAVRDTDRDGKVGEK